MNNTFCLRRTAAYATKFYTEYAQTLIYAGCGTLLLLIGGCLLSNNNLMFIAGAQFLLIFWIMGMVHLNTHNTHKRQEAVSVYLLPATKLEKYLSIWFHSLVVPLAVYAVLLCATVCISQSTFFDLHLDWKMVFGAVFSVKMLAATLAFHALSLLICASTHRNPMLWYVVALAAYLVVDIGFRRIEIDGVVPFYNIFPPVKSWITMTGDQANISIFGFSALTEATCDLLEMGFFLVTACVFWVAGYFRFYEREIK